jgi:hypothetical protein
MIRLRTVATAALPALEHQRPPPRVVAEMLATRLLSEGNVEEPLRFFFDGAFTEIERKERRGRSPVVADVAWRHWRIEPLKELRAKWMEAIARHVLQPHFGGLEMTRMLAQHCIRGAIREPFSQRLLTARTREYELVTSSMASETTRVGIEHMPSLVRVVRTAQGVFISARSGADLV